MSSQKNELSQSFEKLNPSRATENIEEESVKID